MKKEFITILLTLITYRLLGVFCIQTSFVPDEYWQALEVAHNLTFGYGYITWEWQQQIRSFTYPLLISLIYRILPDSKFAIVHGPRILQALLTSISDFSSYQLSCKLFGKAVGRWMLFNIFSSWFLFYCAPRTLTNMAEASFTQLGLYFFPWNLSIRNRSSLSYLWFAGFATLIRPTGIILWIPLYLWHVWKTQSIITQILIKTIFIGSCMLLILLLIDRWCYHQWVFTPYQFFLLNWRNDIGAFYGSQGCVWYLVVGFPVVLSLHIVPFVMGITTPKLQNFYLLVLWVIVMLSQLSHKEFRFLLPVIYISLIICSYVMNDIAIGRTTFFGLKVSKKLNVIVASLILIINIPLSIYTSLIHQRGVLDATQVLSQMVTKDSSVLFLMPCHSTPYYSYIHQNITMKFLTCEPNLDMKENYSDEADIFYNNPKDWLNSHYGNFFHEKSTNDKESLNKLPTHIVMFDVLYSRVFEFLAKHNYILCYSTFHSHFNDGRVGNKAQIYCKK